MSNIINSHNSLKSIININKIKNDPKEIKQNSDSLDLERNFLNLLMAQIKNQDPIDPIKNTELTSQLAQINTVSGIQKLNYTVNKFSNQINKNQNIQVASLIGHHVMIPSSKIFHIKNQETKFGIKLDKDASFISISLKDEKGNIIYSKEFKDLKSNLYNLVWNGKTLSQKDADTGMYYISMIAKNKDINVPVQLLSHGIINSVTTSTTNEPIMNLGPMGKTTLSNIYEILT